MVQDKFNVTISNLLEAGRLSYVIGVLRRKCESALPSHPDLAEVITSLDKIADTYTHLRGFMLSGAADPGRNDTVARLKLRVKDLARNYLFIVNEDRLDPLFSEYRLQKVRRSSASELLAELEKTDFRISMARETETDPMPFLQKKEQISEALFRRVWSLPPWATDDFKALEEYLSSDKAEFPVVAQIVTALMLGMLKFNDPAKFRLLIAAYNDAADEKIAARALTAIVLSIGRWGNSVVSTPEIAGLLAELEDSLLTYSRVRDIVMTLIRTRDTDRVSREVNDAFNSTMKEISPEMLEKLQREGLTVDSSETGINPEWEKLMQNKDLEERMKAINDMQLEGMDVMMQTFSRLKSFPFFNSVANWFLPFSMEHSAVAPLFSTFNGEGFIAMADATDMCAGDRFSFALGLMQMPEQRRNMLAIHLGSQLDAIRDMVKDKTNVRTKPEFATEALVFARDIYRFVKLYPRRRDFHDPFAEPIDFLRLPLLGALLRDDDIVLTSADFYFHYGYYPQALALYETARTFEEPGRELYEKMGYCRQMLSDFSGALADYEKADLFSSDADRSSSWLLRKLALCNKALGRYDVAADYYSRLLEGHPNDTKLEFQLAGVLLRSSDFARGKELMAKVHYLHPDNLMAERVCTRLKGHDAFLEGKYREALSLYEAARGDQQPADYHRDLLKEIVRVNPLADIEALKILLDSGN